MSPPGPVRLPGAIRFASSLSPPARSASRGGLIHVRPGGRPDGLRRPGSPRGSQPGLTASARSAAARMFSEVAGDHDGPVGAPACSDPASSGATTATVAMPSARQARNAQRDLAAVRYRDLADRHSAASVRAERAQHEERCRTPASALPPAAPATIAGAQARLTSANPNAQSRPVASARPMPSTSPEPRTPSAIVQAMMPRRKATGSRRTTARRRTRTRPRARPATAGASHASETWPTTGTARLRSRRRRANRPDCDVLSPSSSRRRV